MTRLARGAKCGNSLPLLVLVSVDFPNKFGFNNEANASDPIPVVARPKNWRRFSFNGGLLENIHVLIPVDRFIQIQHHPGNIHPSRVFDWIQLIFQRRFANLQHLFCSNKVRFIVLKPIVQIRSQNFKFRFVGQSRCCQFETKLQLRLRIASTFNNHSASKMSRCLNKLGTVQQQQCL